MNKFAVLSGCKTYRYSLHRQWDAMLPVLGFLMLNPSTADASVDDPTIRKCIGFAKRNGYGSVAVVNLYAYRSTEPKVMQRAADPVGPLNDLFIAKVLRDIRLTHGALICAWGAHAKDKQRIAHVLGLVRSSGLQPHYLALSKSGQPCHPLMLAYSNKINLWSPPCNSSTA